MVAGDCLQEMADGDPRKSYSMFKATPGEPLPGTDLQSQADDPNNFPPLNDHPLHPFANKELAERTPISDDSGSLPSPLLQSVEKC